MMVIADKLKIKYERKPIPLHNIIQANMDIAKLLNWYLALYFELKGIVTDVTATMKTVPNITSK